MSEKVKLKLSELDDHVEIGRDDSCHHMTVGEMKHEILHLDEPHHKHTDWYTLKPEKWRPSAEGMLEQYIENEYNNGMYEDWDERANDCIKPEHIEKIQAVLDQAFEDGHATEYWTYEQPVEIDIFPEKHKEKG